jgi:drug/metabolite transporter (DMT)-like permease
LGFAALVGFSVLGQVGFKLAADRLGMVRLELAWLARFLSTPAVLLILLGNVGALVSYLRLLKVAAIGPVFAAAHLSVVAVVVVSFIVWHERLGALQLAGCAAIIAGVCVLAATEKPEAG